jgi:ABC-2 type transport system permease protein
VNATAVAVRAGLRRGWVETRQILTKPTDLLGFLWPWIIALGVLYFLRDRTVPGTGFSLSAQAIPGLLGMNVVLTGMQSMAVWLVMERDDGTLLRAKAVPNGMTGYLTGKVATGVGMTTVTMLIMLAPAPLLFDGLRLGSLTSWLLLAGVLVLGLVATLPLGAILGSVFKDMGAVSFVTLLIMGLVAISGIFYPITALPGWLQAVGQVFPVYWLGLGMRSALLPDALAAVEIGGSWRHLEMLGALGIWAVIGFVFAPMLLRRMARRESGSALEVRRAASAVADRMRRQGGQ